MSAPRQRSISRIVRGIRRPRLWEKSLTYSFISRRSWDLASPLEQKRRPAIQAVQTAASTIRLRPGQKEAAEIVGVRA